MGSRKERTSDRLFSNGTKWVMLTLFAALIVGFSLLYRTQPEILSSVVPANPEASVAATEAGHGSLPVAAQKEGSSPLSEAVKKEIEDLFTALNQNPEAEVKDRTLRRLRRVLQASFSGQEDCWSCEGVVYFDRFDQIAGAGESRKPIGFREWLQDGDEAYEEQRRDDARKFYTEALQILDERSLEEGTPVDPELIERIRSRCLELGCR